MRLGLLLSLVISFCLSGCATAPPDIPVCIELSLERGYCINTISSTEFEVNSQKPYKFDGKTEQTWWDARPKMVMVPSKSWGRLKAYIIETCKMTGQCDQSITSWQRTIQSVDTALETK